MISHPMQNDCPMRLNDLRLREYSSSLSRYAFSHSRIVTLGMRCKITENHIKGHMWASLVTATRCRCGAGMRERRASITPVPHMARAMRCEAKRCDSDSENDMGGFQ